MSHVVPLQFPSFKPRHGLSVPGTRQGDRADGITVDCTPGIFVTLWFSLSGLTQKGALRVNSVLASFKVIRKKKKGQGTNAKLNEKIMILSCCK